MKALTFFLFCFLGVSVTKGQKPNLVQLIADSNIAGAQLIWIKNGKVSYQNAGYADTKQKIKVTKNTLFQAASLSKVVLAYVCLTLVDQQTIDLDRPLSKYFNYPRISEDSAAQKITARMVLKHLSGFPNWAEGPGRASWKTSKLTTQFEPGTKWQYSGEGFFYLQATIEHLLKKDFQQIASEMVFRPLGMKHSTFVWDNKFDKITAYGHQVNGEQDKRSTFLRSNSAYTLLTTASDYALFLKELSKKQLNHLMDDQITLYSEQMPYELAKHISWGLGIGIYSNEIGKTAWHWGDNGNFKGFFILNPEKNEILICLTNHTNGLKLMPVLANAYFGKAVWFIPPTWLE